MPRQGGEPDPLVGVVLEGKFRIDDLIGSGAMGRVYRALHLGLETEVAVKVLRAEQATSRASLERFRREARATSRLRHPNIISILDVGEVPTGQPYIVSELLRGRTLGAILSDEGPLQPRRIAALLGQALDALDAAHAAGVVHRDLKPANIHVTQLRSGEQVKVLDFGLAQVEVSDPRDLHRPKRPVVGTPDYMSPEQIRGEDLDARADVYAMGVILYELLTGMPLYAGELVEVLSGHVHHPPEPPQIRRMDLHIPPALEAVCLRALCKRREDRFASAAEMRRALELAVDDAKVRCTGCGAQVPKSAADCQVCGASMAERSLVAGAGVTLPPPFVGREEELARLVSMDHGAVRVIGRRGSGRSRLVDEWRRVVEAHGGRVAVFTPDPSGARRAWRALRPGLAALLGVAEAPTPAELERATHGRPGQLPGLLEVFGLPGRMPAGETALRRREALAAALGALRSSGAALAFEDVDRYDALSTEVVTRLVRGSRRQRVVATMTDAAELEGGEELRLVPLAARTRAALGLPAIQAGADEGRGSVWPLEIEQELRARGEGAADVPVGQWESVPAGRLAMLPQAARRALAAAAVAGTEADLALVSLAAGFDAAPAAGVLAARGLVRLVRTAVGSAGEGGALRTYLCLPSPTLRDQLYAALPADERSRLHLVLRDTLARQTGRSMADADAELRAHHEWLANPATAEPATLEAAAQAAERSLDDEGAGRWYHRARTRIRTTHAVPGTDARLAVAHGHALRRAGDGVGANAAFDEALALGKDDRRILTEAHRGRSQVALAAGKRAEALAELEAALATAAPPLAAELCLELGEIYLAEDRLIEADRSLRRGLLLASGKPGLTGRLRLAIAEAGRRSGREEPALQMAVEALSDPGLPPGARVQAHLLLCELVREDEARAEEHRRAAFDELRRMGDRRRLAELLLDAAELARDDDLARRWAGEAQELAREIEWTEGGTRGQQVLSRPVLADE